MLRYMPAQYLLAEQPTVRAALRESRRLMKGQVGEMAWLYLGFSGWLFACLALLPYFYVSPFVPDHPGRGRTPVAAAFSRARAGPPPFLSPTGTKHPAGVTPERGVACPCKKCYN